MKKTALAITGMICLALACTKNNGTTDTHVSKPNAQANLDAYAQMGVDSPFLSIDSANKMLGSYIGSSNRGTDDLNSLIVDADALRYYLSNNNIKHIKLMFAHKMNYINTGGRYKYAGMANNALTIIIAGFGSDNNYIYTPQGTVMDFCEPCPANCPSGGTAAYDQFPQ